MTRLAALTERGDECRFRVVWGAGDNNRYLGQAFFEEECDEDQRDQFRAIFQLIEESVDGRIANQKMFKYPLKGQGNIGEFKIHKKRLFFFRDRTDFVITHGATKKRDDTDPADIDRVRRIENQIRVREAAQQPKQVVSKHGKA